MWRREIHRDFFWTGLLLGAVVGGVLGVLLGSETGHRTRQRLERAALQVRSRLNGSVDVEKQPEETQDVSES